MHVIERIIALALAVLCTSIAGFFFFLLHICSSSESSVVADSMNRSVGSSSVSICAFWRVDWVS